MLSVWSVPRSPLDVGTRSGSSKMLYSQTDMSERTRDICWRKGFQLNIREEMRETSGQSPPKRKAIMTQAKQMSADQGGADVIPTDPAHRAAWETEHDSTLSPDQRTCCLHCAAGAFCPPNLKINRWQKRCDFRPLDKTQKHHPQHQSHGKVKVESLQETNGRKKTNLFWTSL